MLDRLPPELLADILDLAAAPQTHGSHPSEQRGNLMDRLERIAPLSSCTLVNRRVSAVARPLFWRNVQLVIKNTPCHDAGKDTVRRFVLGIGSTLGLNFTPFVGPSTKEDLKLAEEDDPRRFTRVLACRFEEPHTIETALHLVGEFPELIEVVLSWKGYPRRSSLYSDQMDAFRGLRSLALSSISLVIECPFKLPLLLELSLNYITLTPDSVRNLLNTDALPSLRFLALCQYPAETFPQPLSFQPNLPAPFLRQLKGLHLLSYPYPSPPTPSSPPYRLLEVPLGGYDPLGKSLGSPCLTDSLNVEIYSYFNKHIISSRPLDELCTYIRDAPPLLAIFLPSCVHPDDPCELFERELDDGTVRARLLQAIEANGAKVVWRTPPQKALLGFTRFSPDFKRFLEQQGWKMTKDESI